MESGATHRTPEDMFRDFRARRAGMIKALTTDVEKFYQQCDPEKENLCLYGLPNETWEVNLPAEEFGSLPNPSTARLLSPSIDLSSLNKLASRRSNCSRKTPR